MALATLIGYAGLGVLVAAVLLARGTAPLAQRVPTFFLHAALWPIFLPLLLPNDGPTPVAASPYAARVDKAERTLSEALAALGRDLEDPLSLEAARVRNLGQAMGSAAARLAELDALIATQSEVERSLESQLERVEGEADAAGLADILHQRLGHLRRLRALRAQAQADLERAMARAGELASRMTLLRYEDPKRDGGAAAKARELTESIEELCRVLNEVRAT
jgi:hypothetical protein